MSRKIIRKPVVQARTGLARSTLDRKVADGTFPHPVELSKRAIGWYEDLVDEWIESRPEARRSTSDPGASA